jgi:hypothetical protein
LFRSEGDLDIPAPPHRILGKFRQSSPELNERLPVQFGISPFADENPHLYSFKTRAMSPTSVAGAGLPKASLQQRSANLRTPSLTSTSTDAPYIEDPT